MTPSIVTIVGILLTGALLFHALRVQVRDSRLKTRLATLGAPVEAPTTESDADWEWLERLFLCSGKDRQEVVMALRGAGRLRPHSVVIFAGLRFVGTAVAAFGIFFLARSGHNASMTLVYTIIGTCGVFLVSKAILRSRVAAHIRRAGKEMPFLLDTLLLLLESGVSLDQAFRYFAQSNLRGLELTRGAVAAMVADLQSGVPYALALERWADRLAVSGVRELASLFKQSLLHGTELSPALRAFTQEFADKRLTVARGSIGRKTTQLTMVMIVFLMPALMIVLAGPAFISVRHAVTGGFH